MKAPVGSIPALVVLLVLAPATALSQTGTISGTVRATGPIPAPRTLEVTKNPEVCGKSLRADDVVVSDGKVAFAIASVEGLTEAPKPAQRVLTNKGCRFDPPVLAAAAGDTLVVDNGDDILHNTHLNLKMGERTRTVGNFALPGKGATVSATLPFRQAGTIDIRCSGDLEGPRRSPSFAELGALDQAQSRIDQRRVAGRHVG